MTNSPPPEGWLWDDKGRHYIYSDVQDGLTVYSAEASERIAEEQRRQGYVVPHRPGQQADWGYRGPSDYNGGRPTQSGTPQDRRPGPADAAESYEVGRIYYNPQGVPFQFLSTGGWAPVQDASTRQPAPASQRSWGEALSCYLQADGEARTMIGSFALRAARVIRIGGTPIAELFGLAIPGPIDDGIIVAFAIRTAYLVHQYRNPEFTGIKPKKQIAPRRK